MGGNGTFGSISNKRRKRVLYRISMENKQRQESDRERESRDLTIRDVERKSDYDASGQEAEQQQLRQHRHQPRIEKGDENAGIRTSIQAPRSTESEKK